MTIWSVLGSWSNGRKRDDVGADAGSLMDIWGDTAFEVAANLSWREDAGLLRTAVPGHWGRVQEEVGRRLSPHARPAHPVALSAEPRIGGGFPATSAGRGSERHP